MKYFVARDRWEAGDVHISSFDPKKMAEEVYALNHATAPIGHAWSRSARLKHAPVEAMPLGALNKNAVANSFGWLIVDKKYKTLLEKHAGLELLPVTLEIAPRKLARDYWIANIFDAREAVDREKSQWKPSPEEGKIRRFDKLALDRRALAGDPVVFKLLEHDGVILFREDLVAAARKAGLTGLDFIEPASFRSA
jgi:hypothetical protein